MIHDHMNIWLLRPGVGGFGNLPTLLDDTDKRGGAEQLGEHWRPIEGNGGSGATGGIVTPNSGTAIRASSCSGRSGFGPQTNSSWSSRTASSRLFSLIGRWRLAGFILRSHGSNCLTIPRRARWWEAPNERRLRSAATDRSLDARRSRLRYSVVEGGDPSPFADLDDASPEDEPYSNSDIDTRKVTVTLIKDETGSGDAPRRHDAAAACRAHQVSDRRQQDAVAVAQIGNFRE